MLRQRKMDFPLDLNKKLNIAHINLCTEAEGPYKRMAIWFQGCSILCEGCCNPELQPIKVAHIMTVEDIVNIAIESKKLNNIEGITFLGGEPTLQEGLRHLTVALANVGLGLILFTGKSIESINSDLVESVDLIVDGFFDINQIDNKRNLIGSKNQQLYFITDRYKSELDWFAVVREKKVEINLKDGALITGDVI